MRSPFEALFVTTSSLVDGSPTVAPGKVSDDGATFASPEQPSITSAAAQTNEAPLRIGCSVPHSAAGSQGRGTRIGGNSGLFGVWEP